MFPLIPDSGVPLNLTAAPTRSAEKEIKRIENEKEDSSEIIKFLVRVYLQPAKVK